MWTDETKQNNGRFTIYGAEEDYEIEEHEDPEFLQKVMAHCMIKNNLVENATDKIPGFKNANDNEAPGCGMYVSYWENGSEKTIKVTHRVPVHDGYELDKAFSGADETQTELKPGDKITLLYKRVENACSIQFGWGYAWSG